MAEQVKDLVIIGSGLVGSCLRKTCNVRCCCH